MANILLVEPDHMLAQTYIGALELAGHSVQVSPTAQSALEVADEVRPDVVLLELQLVAHSGVEFLYEFRSYADWQEVPIVIVSKVPPAEFNQSARMLKEQLGVTTYCYKPQTDLKQLLRVVAGVLSDNQLKVL
jgi:DNA-binding response OmpR family regulator